MSNPLCKFRHIFGREGEGAHAYRVANIAVVDLALTVVGAWLLARWMARPFWLVFAAVMVIGVLVHRMFCVETTLTKIVFSSPSKAHDNPVLSD